MAEQLSGQERGQENLKSPENHEAKEQLDKLGEKLRNRAEKEASGENSAERKKMRNTAEKEAISGKEKAPNGSERKSSREPVHRNHKKLTYKATMRRVESKLPAYQRNFSKVINNDTVDKVSNISSKTVARPSALMGGGVVAFLALLIVTIFANRYGWEVSGSEFIVFMIIGWTLGLLAEGVYKTFRR